VTVGAEGWARTGTYGPWVSIGLPTVEPMGLALVEARPRLAPFRMTGFVLSQP